MFPPKVVGIIGNRGAMAVNVVAPFFERAECKVIGSDIRNPDGLSNEDVVMRADLVYFSILPINAVAPLIRSLMMHARPNTCWLHGTSVQNSDRAPITKALEERELLVKSVTTGYLHFMFGPSVHVLSGQSVLCGFPRPMQDQGWKNWLLDKLSGERLNVFVQSAGDHDTATENQVILAMLSLLGARLFSQTTLPLHQVLDMMGPPAYLKTSWILRQITQIKIMADILLNHPASGKLLVLAKQAVADLTTAYSANDPEALIRIAEEWLRKIPEGELQGVIERTTAQIQFEGTSRRAAIARDTD